MTPVKKTTKKVETPKEVNEIKTEAAVQEAPAAEAPKAKKKAAAKKAAAPKKKAAPAAPAASVTIEFAGGKILAKDILDKALASYKEAHADAVVETIELYIQPELNVAYYVVNGEGSEDFKVSL